MADYVIIAGKIVINANTDIFGRSIGLTGAIYLGSNTVVDQNQIVSPNVTANQLTTTNISVSSGITVGNSSVNLTLSPTGLSTLGSLTVSNTSINGGLSVTGSSTLQTLNATAINSNGNIVITNVSDSVLTLITTLAPANTYRQKAIYSSVNVGGGSDWLFRSTRPSDGAVRDVQFTSTGFVWMSGNFDPNTKYDKTGGAITGSLSTTGNMVIGGGVNGFTAIQTGNPTNSGYMEFWNANTASREGYIGFAGKTDGIINLSSERTGGYFNFVGNIPRIAGQAIWYAGNFNPGSYAALGGNVSFNRVSVTDSGGSGQNIQVGDDAWLGDINVGNAIGIKGQQNADRGYIRFGTPGGTFGFDSSNWTMTGGGNLYIQPSGGGNYPVWHSGNFNPGSYAAMGGTPNFASIGFTGGQSAVYKDGGIDNVVVRTGNTSPNVGYKYFTFDPAGAFNVINGSITTGGDVIANGRLVAGNGQGASYIEMRDTDNSTRFVHNNDGTVGFLGKDGNWKLRVYDDGSVWFAQFGDVNNQIEKRAGDYAALRVAKGGDTMTGDLEIQKNYPKLRLHYGGVRWWDIHTREDGNLHFWKNGDTSASFYFPSDGNLVANAWGNINITTYINNTAAAYANTRQGALGFIPTQQGGGANQQNNKLYFGWDGARIRAQVDSSDLGGLFAQGQINPIQDMRLLLNENAPASRFAGEQQVETTNGAVITGLGLNGAGGIISVRTRQLQKLDSYGNWYAANYAS